MRPERETLDYSQAINALLAMVDHERSQAPLPRQKLIYDLRRMEALLARLGNPHLAVPTIHVAGTKGKGSVAAICDSVLHAAGYRTGFYSSPHLHTFRERIRRDTQPLGEPEFAGLVEQLLPQARQVEAELGLGPVSLFEFMTGMAFQCYGQGYGQGYAQDRVDFQTIEVGLGGRLDATNVVRPQVCVITSISLDHMAILGDTIAQIAGEKAGIIKPGAAVVVALQRAEALEVILAVCRESGVRPVIVGKDVTWTPAGSDITGQDVEVKGRLGDYQLRTPLLGAYQLENAAAALAALEVLRELGHVIPDDAIQQGFAAVSWPCRLEVLSRRPLVVADGAHNPYSMAALLESLPSYLDYRRLVVVAGFSRDKNVSEMVRLLARRAEVVYATRSRHPRSAAPAALAAEFQSRGAQTVECATVAEALAQALSQAKPGDLVLGAGSLFVAAELREAVLGIPPELYPDLLPPDLQARGAEV
ncbi:MAG: bifunctional folylpolyglutamate synthase/dihydrofolate synthase [Dehalococcoidia bacterium]|nr:bifunctional folylpolyglutamate synthase/dihydrofolate synthase [Dehalococcoidia bacterium]MSQ16368.1 bifunctional folylpolyglutamate synthase/dihydrofolate synthase [Dehalococcoidia bacterium]